MYITVHVYTMYVHGFTRCLNRFRKDGEFVQTNLYCVHTYINVHERVGTMYIQIYYIMNMYVYPLFCIVTYLHVCTVAGQCIYLSVHGSSWFIQSHTMNMQFLSLPKIFP